MLDDMTDAATEELVDPGVFHRLNTLKFLRPGLDLSEAALTRNYREINKTQRQAANVLLRNVPGIAWREALERADAMTWRSLENRGLAFFLPSSRHPERVAASLEHRFMLGYRAPNPASLLEALFDYRLEILQLMAAHWGIDAGPRGLMSAGIYAAAREERCRTAAALPLAESEILSAVAAMDDLGTTRADLTPPKRRPFFDFGREDFMRAPPAQERALHALIVKGLVVFQDRRQAFEFDPARGTRLYAVAGLEAALKKAASAPSGAPALIVAPPDQALSHADGFLRDLARALIGALSVPVEVTASWQITKSSLRKLAAVLRVEDHARLERLIIFLYAQQLLSEDRRRLFPCREIAQALEQTARNYPDSALSFGADVQSQHWRSLRYFHSAQGKADVVRAEAARHLAALPARQWASVEGLAAAMLADEKSAALLHRSWYLGQTHRDHCRILGGALRQELRILLDLGAVETDPALEKARPSPLLGPIIEKKALDVPPEAVDRGMGLVVQPNLEVLAPLSLPLADQYVLARAGELQSVEHMALYVFSLPTLYNGMRNGVPPAALRATLLRHSKTPLPRAFEALLQEFESRADEAVVIAAPLLVRVRRPEAARFLERTFAAQALDGAPGYYAIPGPGPLKTEAVLAGLERKGYYPTVDATFSPTDEDEGLPR